MRLLDIGTRLNQMDIGVTIRRTFDTSREQVAAVIIEWLLDLTRSRLGTDRLVLREVISTELLSARKKDSGSLASNLEASKIYTEVENPVRLDWFFLYHTRLWKKPRLNLKQIYVSILTLSYDYRIAVGMFYSLESRAQHYSFLFSLPVCRCLSSYRGFLSTCGPRGRNLHQIFCTPNVHCSEHRRSYSP